MDDTYRTIAAPAEGLYKEKGSRFIALASPVQNEDEVREALQQLRQEYYDARHHCYAFVLGPKRDHFRASDGGEPAHTAGTPILGQIRSRELTNVLVVVVRYFGGTKLGVPGLIAAYKQAAADALEKATVIEQHEMAFFEVSVTFEKLSDVYKIQKETGALLIESHYDTECCMKMQVRKKNASELFDHLNTLGNLRIKLVE